MKKIIILALFLVAFNFTQAQESIGLHYDITGRSLHEHFDPILYNSTKKIISIYVPDDFESGYYIDNSGNKINGYIKLKQDKIFFKEPFSDKQQKILADEIQSFVIGIDSFFVLDNFYMVKAINKKPNFAQFVCQFGDYTYAKHYKFMTGFEAQYTQSSTIEESYLVKHKDSLAWVRFPENNLRKFKKMALSYFGHIPYLKQKIEDEEYKSDKLYTLIKMTEYFYKYKNSKPIFYNAYWQEIKDASKAVYTANIVAKEDSIWTLEYFKDAKKIYTARYSSFYPNIKNGDFIAYHPNGTKRLEVALKNDKPKAIKTYTVDGQLKTAYKYTEPKDSYIINTDIDKNYVYIKDAEGNNVLDKPTKIKYSQKETINGVDYTIIYNKNRLQTVYRVAGKDTIFHITNPNYDFKTNALQRRFNNFMEEKKFIDALDENAQGTLLVSMRINPKGFVEEAKILNEIHSEIDLLLDKFIKTNLLSQANNRMKFKPIKKGREKRYFEVVIPFDFSIDRFYRKPTYYYYNFWYHNNWFFHQQFIYEMQQRTIMQNAPRTF